MSSADVWMDAKFIPHITDQEAAAFEDLLKEYMPVHAEECIALSEGFTVGWVSYDDRETILNELIDQLPEGTSIELVTEYTSCDGSDAETTWHGPKAKELEIQWINTKIFALNRRKDQLERQLAAQAKA